MVENVRDAGGEVKIFSSMHISGERMYHGRRKFHFLEKIIVAVTVLGGGKNELSFSNFSIPELAQLTGVAAILRFPMPELEEGDDDVDDDEDSD